MDTQRLILFVVFSASALMLWEAWQKEYRPPPPVVASTPAKSSAATDLPPTPVPPSAPPSATGALPAGPTAPGVERAPSAMQLHEMFDMIDVEDPPPLARLGKQQVVEED